MNAVRLFTVGCSILSMCAASIACAAPPLVLDGHLDDLRAVATARATDPVGDVEAAGHKPFVENGRDLVELVGYAELSRMWLGVEFAGVENADDEEGLLLLLDTDADATTGEARDGLGCELVWDLGGRKLITQPKTMQLENSRTLRPLAALGIVVAPTITDRRLEIMIPYRMPDGRTLFDGPRVRVALVDTVSGDRIPESGYLELGWTREDLPVTVIPLERERPTDLRIASFNVEHDGLLKVEDLRRQDAIARLLRAVNADVWIVCEVWDPTTALEVRDRIAALLGENAEQWNAVKEDSGNVILTRLPIVQSGEVITDIESDDPRERHRVSYALIHAARGQVVVMANHWRCCNADDKRQQEADGVVRFFGDLRSRGGLIDVPDRTPVFLAGDFNLVGLREPLDTVLSGDIDDEDRFGRDLAPDWDGSALDAITLRHPEAPFTHTWRSTGQPYYPGRLDWAMVTGSVVELGHHYALDTTTLSEATLAKHGLHREDSTLASDHAVLVVDLR